MYMYLLLFILLLNFWGGWWCNCKWVSTSSSLLFIVLCLGHSSTNLQFSCEYIRSYFFHFLWRYIGSQMDPIREHFYTYYNAWWFAFECSIMKGRACWSANLLVTYYDYKLYFFINSSVFTLTFLGTTTMI